MLLAKKHTENLCLDLSIKQLLFKTQKYVSLSILDDLELAPSKSRSPCNTIPTMINFKEQNCMIFVNGFLLFFFLKSYLDNDLSLFQ